MTTRIRDARIIDPVNDRDEVGDLWMGDDGSILAAAPDRPADTVIDAKGWWLLPGLVDLSARLGEPGYSHRGTIASETAAAASAGITTLACPPDCLPVVDSAAAARHLKERLAESARVRVRPIGALTGNLAGESLSDMDALQAAGCVGVSNALEPVRDTRVLHNALQYAASLDLTVHLYPVDPWLVGSGIVHQGRTATRHGLDGVPSAAERAALARDLVLVEDTGARVHFGRLSCARSAGLVARARADGLPVSADVAMHQLFLTELDVTGFDARCHLVPPLRDTEDRDGLRAALADGTLSAICSDHMPLDRDAKLAPFAETLPGLSGLETLLALGLRLVEEDVIDLARMVDVLCAGPSRILGEQRGHLAPGAPADLLLLDPDAIWTLETARMHSHAHSTPFEGWEFRGRVMQTFVDGKKVFDREM